MRQQRTTITKKGDFAAARKRNLGRQRVFDALKEMREKGEAWVTMRETGCSTGRRRLDPRAPGWLAGKLYRCRIAEQEVPFAEALVSANGQVVLSDVVDKDGLWVYDGNGNRRGVGGNVHILAYVQEKHLVLEC